MKIKNILIFSLKLLITISVIWWIERSCGWTRIVDSVRHASILWLTAALALGIAGSVAGALQWSIILKNRAVSLRFMEILRMYFISMFLNNFVFGMVTGDVYRIASVRSSGSDGKRGLAATFLDRLAGLVTLSVFAIGGGVFILLKDIRLNKEFNYAAAVLALFTLLFLAVFALVCSTRLQLLSRRILQHLSWLPGNDRMRQVMEQTFMNLHTPQDRAMFYRVALVSTIVQAMRIGVHVLCAVALGIFAPSQICYFFVIIPVVALIMIVPLPVGVRETVAGSLFGVAGFLYHEALVMEFLATIAGIAGSLPGAVVFLKNSALRNAPNAA